MGGGASVNKYQVEQVKVSFTRKGYPSPSPPKFFLSDLRPKPKLLHHNDGDVDNGGTDWSKVLAPHLMHGDDSDRPGTSRTVMSKARINSGLRPTSEPSKQRQGQLSLSISFDKLDFHARSAPSHMAESFSDLNQYFIQAINREVYPETFLVRAITVWLCNQHVEKDKYGIASLKTPRGILQHLKQKTLSYAGAYALLCRAADVATVIIPGVVKAGEYEPGYIIEDGASDLWCAVHVDGSWQLVHPLWVCRGSYSNAKDGRVMIEYDQALSEAVANNNKGENKNNSFYFLDDYFMPKPEFFIYRCFARDIHWHLIPIQRTLKSQEEFMMLSNMSPMFFKLGLTLLSQPYSVLNSYEGRVTVDILSPLEHAHLLTFKYKIRSIEVTEPTHKMLRKNVISKLVLYYRSNERFIFDVNLPSIGSYMFEITGGLGKNIYNLCKFKIDCHSQASGCVLLPVDPGCDGWGPGLLSERVGLVLPSKPSGVLYIPPPIASKAFMRPSTAHADFVADISFHLIRNMCNKFDYSAELLPPDTTVRPGDNNGKPAERLENHVEYAVDFTNKLFNVKVTVPSEGEYALVIKATEVTVRDKKRSIHGSAKPVCFYLLRTTDKFEREPTPNKLAKAELQTAIQTGIVNDVKTALSKCVKLKVSSTDNVVAAAEMYLEYLLMIKDMTDCIKRRNIAVVNDTLRKVSRYRYRAALATHVEKLVQFRRELLAE